MNILRSAQVDQSYDRYKSSIKSREQSQIKEGENQEEDQLSQEDENELEEGDEMDSEKELNDHEEAKVGATGAAAAPPHASITDKDFYKAMQKIKDRGSGSKPPKKPASAYILFQKEKRAEILKRSPKAKVTEVVKEIAKCWRALNKE